ncbi:hypothetical protein PENSPDRAFT_193895 [Peniophora sp. CONT]|nr:hypothetical protein PENSPDRAFT_193895 [Peniophora sp. CONT]
MPKTNATLNAGGPLRAPGRTLSTARADTYYEYLLENPAAILKSLKDSYRTRSPTDTVELYELTEAVSHFAGGLSDPTKFFDDDYSSASLWRALRESGLCAFIEQVVSSPDFFLPVYSTVWTMQIMDIVWALLICHCASRTSCLCDEHVTLYQFTRVANKLFKNAWEHRDALSPGSWELDGHLYNSDAYRAKQLRVFLAKLFFEWQIGLRPSTPRYPRDNTAQADPTDDMEKLSFIFWLYVDDLSAPHQQALLHLMARKLVNKPVAAAGYITRVILPISGQVAFLQRARETLTNPRSFVGKIPQDILMPLITLLKNDTFIPYLRAMGMINNLYDFLGEQTKLNDDDSVGMRFSCIYMVSDMLSWMMEKTQSVNLLDSLSPLVNDPELVEVSVALVQRFVYQHARERCQHTCHLFVKDYLERLATTIIEARSRNKPFLLIESAVRTHWEPILKEISRVKVVGGAEAKKQVKLVVDTWRAIGEKTGLANKALCHWSKCQWNKVPPTVPLMKCSGCSTVTYCSKTCQTKDWSAGHKTQCTKAAATSA